MRIYIIMLVVGLLLLFAGCKGKEDGDARQIAELYSQLQQMKSENEKLKEEYRQLKKKYEQLKNVYNLQDEVLSTPDREKSSGIYDEVFQ